MYINNFSSDEKSLSDNLVDQELFSQQDEMVKKEGGLNNKVIFEEEFEEIFNKVFNKKSQDDLLENDDYQDKSIFLNPETVKKNTNIHPDPEEAIIVNAVQEKSDKAFPFTKGIGLNEILKSKGYSIINNSSSKIILSTYDDTNKVNMGYKFRITDYYTDEKGKKKKEKKKRKFKPDDIRKKIKAKFHKTLKNKINSNLKKAGAVKLFDFFPQSFITNVSIKLNKPSFGLTYEKLIQQDYSSEIYPAADRNKYYNNIDVLNYLKENKKICKLSDFDKIKDMKYMDILKAYFFSSEFEQSVIELFNKKEKIEYIEQYVNKALTYVNFYNNKK